MKKLWIIIAIVVALVVVLVVIQRKKEPKEIKIGHISPLTGDVAIYGEWEKQGIELAVEEINAQGGIRGKKIKVIHEDDEASPQKGVNAITKLIKSDKVSAIIGASASSVTLAIAPIAEKNKVVLISPVSAAIKISDAGDYIFRVFPSNAEESKKLIKIAKSLKFTKAATIFINNDFGSELAKVTADQFAKDGGSILLSEGYDQEAKDFRTMLTKIKEKSPEVVFLLGYPKDMALICKQAKELALKVQFLAPDTFFSPDIVKWSEGGAEGVIFVTPAKGIEERWQVFSDKIKKKYNAEPNIATAMAYDATYLLTEAMKQGGFNGPEIKNSLYQIKEYPGITGDITFDEKGDVKVRPMDIYIIKNGQFIKYQLPG